jgi:hypothetical protein
MATPMTRPSLVGRGSTRTIPPRGTAALRLGAATMLRACAGLPKTSKPRMGHARFMSRSAMSDMDLRRRGIAAGGRMAQAYFSWSRRAPFGQNSR